jgi:hypothetical protein
MAYQQSKYAPRNNAPVAQQKEGEKQEFKRDPNEVGIGYARKAKSGMEYTSFIVTKDIPAGSSVSIFLNDKVQNRTEKTPTHKMKLAPSKK